MYFSLSVWEFQSTNTREYTEALNCSVILLLFYLTSDLLDTELFTLCPNIGQSLLCLYLLCVFDTTKIQTRICKLKWYFLTSFSLDKILVGWHYTNLDSRDFSCNTVSFVVACFPEIWISPNLDSEWFIFFSFLIFFQYTTWLHCFRFLVLLMM